MAKLAINRLALRRVLGGDAAIIETADALKATGRPTVNVGVVWAYFTTSVYASGDLPVIATREALQNSVDAIRRAEASRAIARNSGAFTVQWDGQARSLSWEDNGVGMDGETILTKFLSLGDTGKSDSTSSDEQAGGFGIAKAVILGTSSTFTWRLWTRDNLAVSNGVNGEVQIFDSPYRQGTKIQISDVAEKFDQRYNFVRDRYEGIEQRLREVLAANDLPNVTITLNGSRIEPFFSRRGGSEVAKEGFGPGTEARVRAYRRPPGDRRGAFWIRLNGLFQFLRRSSVKLPADIVVDLTTTLRPGQDGYPLTAARDDLQSAANRAFSELQLRVEQENESVGNTSEHEIYLPADEGASDIARASRAALEDAGMAHLLAEAATVVDSYMASASTQKRVPARVDSKAPAGSRPLADLQTAIDTAQSVLLSAGQHSRSQSLDSLRSGNLTAVDRDAALDAVVAAADIVQQAASKPTDGGLLAASQKTAAMAPLTKLFPVADQRTAAANVALRISRRNFDPRRARAFKRSLADWTTQLVVWDAALRLVASAGRIIRKFYSGWVLDDKVDALVALEGTARPVAVVYLHPYTFERIIKTHSKNPSQIAYWLHATAVHELTHLDGRMGEGHSEAYVAAREELGTASAPVLAPLESLVKTLLLTKKRAKPDPWALRGWEMLLEQLVGAGLSETEMAAVMRLKPTIIKQLQKLLASDAR